MKRSKTFIATPPGVTIKEQLVDRGMSQKEFAARMEMSEKHISNLINGDVQLTTDVAMRLELVLGLPASFWSNLEAVYREKLLKVEAENEMEADMQIAKNLPYNEMAKNGWIPETKKGEDRVINLRKYFEVVRLGLLKDNLIPGIACRRQSITEKADFALIAWAQKAKLEARHIVTAPIDLKTLTESIPSIRAMTKMKPSVFCPKLIELLANCGIALVFLPHIGGSFLHGATFYDKNKIVIGLTVRGKDADKFWFSLFHEIAHILLGHISQAEGTTEEDEAAADAYARDTLIPKDVLQRFVMNHTFTKETIRDFANQIGIDVGIVVGRLQKEGYIQYSWHNELKTRYEIA